MKKKANVNPSDKVTSVHDHLDKPDDYMDNKNESNKVNTTPTENIVVEPTETTIDSYVEPSGNTFIETPTKPTFEPIG